jgi:3-deoxy-D-manno-octulosonate 8-phosphate phosphatase KdsC-like HAD superfamily phosphatase
MAFHIELRVNLVKTLQVPIFYSSYLNKRKPYYKLLKKYSNSFDETALIYAHFGDGPIIFKTINYVVSVYCVK